MLLHPASRASARRASADQPFRIDTHVEVPLPQEDAFDIYVERVVEWQTAVDLTRTDTSPGLIGREYLASYPLLGLRHTGTFRLLGAEPPAMVEFEASGSGISVWYRARFLGRRRRTLVMVQGDYRLPDTLLGRMADRLGVERMVRRDIDRAMESYRQLCRAVAAEAMVAVATAGEGAVPAWSASLTRFEAAQDRYREALDGGGEPGALAAAQTELLGARGQIEQLKRTARTRPTTREADRGD